MSNTDLAAPPKLADCSCLALRQAARHVTQFYDHSLAPTGLRTTQYSILARLRFHGPMTINALAADLVMDRTTLGRNILPLERDGLISIVKGSSDRRQKELHLTDTGASRLRDARPRWTAAQTRFEATFGADRAAELRALLGAVVTSELVPAGVSTPVDDLVRLGHPHEIAEALDDLVPVSPPVDDLVRLGPDGIAEALDDLVPVSRPREMADAVDLDG